MRGGDRSGAARARDSGGEAGGVTVVACVALLALLTLTVLVAQVGVAVVGRHRAQSAADLAALAAAAGLDRGTAAGCARAEEIARRMGVRIVGCTVAEWDVTITVEGRMTLGPLGVRSVRAMARAGPIGDDV
ncbi:MAG: flp pilus-assembly TadE/G-like family protein [Nocardia sp.]|uniref:Rv3654c family TadE-like protein n=1 Tax=Nocardia sp. TaxID=1821 RepID=UPI00262FAD41|nr:Rv3654c family TadE-like protein [Nocardia sp.]MCU1647570.1 flp pilus-assembly TadE/G-like family protein [Nocardia sp.]